MRVDDAMTQLQLVQTPGNFRAEVSGDAVYLRASPIQVTARCRVDADATFQAAPANLTSRTDPRLAPRKLGFMQVQTLETLWAYYRGTTNAEGSLLNDWSARRQQQICRDYKPSLGTVWYEGSASVYDCYGLPDLSRPPPWNLEFYFGDNPRNDISAHMFNDRTQRRNYLHEVRWSTAFVTTLTEQTSIGVYKHHRHFFWSGIWHFQATNPGPQHLSTGFRPLPGCGFWRSDFKRGGPVDTRYLAVLNDPNFTLSCNEVVQNAPVVTSLASDWQRFPVMDQKDRLFA